MSMAQRLIRGFGKKQAADSEPPPNSPQIATPPPGSPPSAPEGPITPQTRSALELAQELLRGIEHFVLSTPDLDAPSFLDRLRRMAAQLTPGARVEDLELQKKWAVDSLSAFGQLQRRYLSEREDELWRLLSVYQDNLKVEGASNNQFHESLRGVHERMGNVVRLDDLRQVRERLEHEINRAGSILEQKAKLDDERAAVLAAQVQQLEAMLVAARDEANRDPMTGVFNRSGFQTQLEAALQSPNSVSLAMIDVDNFKGINDTLGHLVGDHILRFAVQVLSKVARPGDIIGRYGGDEFCLMSPGTPAARLSDRFNTPYIQQNLNFTFEEKFYSVKFGLSVGIANSQAGDTPDSLIHRADNTLLGVKRSGKGHARVAPAEAG